MIARKTETKGWTSLKQFMVDTVDYFKDCERIKDQIEEASDSKATLQSLKAKRDRKRRSWVENFRATTNVEFCKMVNRYRLPRIELEIVSVLAMSELCVTKRTVSDIDDLMRIFEDFDTKNRVDVIATFFSGSKLIKNNLIHLLEEANLSNSGVILGQDLHDTLKTQNLYNTIEFKDQKDCKSILTIYLRKAYDKADKVDDLFRGFIRNREGDHLKAQLDYEALHRKIVSYSLANKDSYLHQLMVLTGDEAVRKILLILLGKALDVLPNDHELFKGKYLSYAVCGEKYNTHENYLSLFQSDSKYIEGDLFQIDGADSMKFYDSDACASALSYCLGSKSMLALNLENAVRASVRGTGLVTPSISFDNLVFDDDIKKSLNMAITQNKKEDKLYREWGIGSLFPYGKALSMIFSGPPGTGKTAAAEAFCKEIERKLYVVSYAKLQSCFVGQTEKRISEIFKTAGTTGSVLFFDEADSLLTDRSASTHSWEVSQVNVLLQELELFEGICIFATNRIASLDKALDRRIGIKINFDRPTKEIRRKIWEKLIPSEMPIENGLDFRDFGDYDLSGGQIKNAVINAARIAVMRNEAGNVTKDDFLDAINMEIEGAWSKKSEEKVGFRSSTQPVHKT